MNLEVVIAVFTCDINATRLHNDSLIPSLLPSFLFLCHSLLFRCQQICPEWSWWGTRTPSWGHARCPSWDRRNRASWPSPAHLYSASIWRRRKSPWLTTAWLWTSGTLWFIYFSRVHAFSIQRLISCDSFQICHESLWTCWFGFSHLQLFRGGRLFHSMIYLLM